MGLFSNDPKRAAAKKELRDAHDALDKLGRRQHAEWKAKGGKGGVPENPAYWKANQRVIDAEKNVRWYERG